MANPDGPKDIPPSKTAVPTVLIKKNKGGDEESEDKKFPDGQGKQKTLPTGLSRAIVIASVLASLIVVAANLFSGRYEVVPAPNSANSFIYRLDRLTGAIKFCGPQSCTDVNTAAEK